MLRKSRWFLGAACAAMIVALARTLDVPVGEGITHFSTGLAAALMFGVLVTWKRPGAQ